MAFTLFRQADSIDCGPTCLQMIAQHYGKHYSISFLRNKAEIGKEGVSILGISNAAESIGFRTQAVKLPYEQLSKDALLPAVLHWKQNHFVVLYKAKRSKLYIADPAKGLIQYSPTEFKHNWLHGNDSMQNGVALLLEPSPEFYKNVEGIEEDNKKIGFRNIFTYIFPFKKLVTQLLLGLLLASLLQLLLPFLTQSIVDIGINTSNIGFINLILLAQLALFSGRIMVEFIRGWILLHISTRVNISILTDFLIKLMKLPISFFDTKRTGDIIQRMNDHSRIESFLTGSSLNAVFSLLSLVILSIVLAAFNIQIFALFFGLTALYSFWIICFLKRRRNLDYKKFEISAEERSTTIQLIQGMQDIKINGIEKSMRWGWEHLQAKLFRLSSKVLALNQTQQAGALFINEGKNILITFLSAKAVIDGDMTLGGMLAVQSIIGQLNSPVEQMISFIQSWQNAKISMDRLNEIHKIEDEEPAYMNHLQELPLSFTKKLTGGMNVQLESYESLSAAQHSSVDKYEEEALNNNPQPGYYEHEESMVSDQSGIKIENLSFTYSGAGNPPVLKNIDLLIPRGKTTAIVGISGSGKTTLLKLLLKFYDPQKGKIKVGNTALNNISHRLWRKQCGVVMQESFIFSESIARNIAVGMDRIDGQLMEKALEVANITQFIDSLPHGIHTKIGADGTGLSMGQKQRILLARAVYRNPEIILLDEATNSLDANNEQQIMRNFNDFLKGKTVIVVAHRLSTVKNADQIVVLNKGKITEKGTHSQLIGLKGEYYTLVRNQLDLEIS